MAKSPKYIIDEVTRREGKKRAISRAQVSEVLGHMIDMEFEAIKNGSSLYRVLAKWGRDRARRRKARSKRLRAKAKNG